jgi:hypothetical protein
VYYIILLRVLSVLQDGKEEQYEQVQPKGNEKEAIASKNFQHQDYDEQEECSLKTKTATFEWWE